MDEQEIAEQAWAEGAYAVIGLSPATAFTVPNPYALGPRVINKSIADKLPKATTKEN
jgi:hypothetical protein